MRLMQRLAISGLLSVILILLLTGTFITRRDLASVVDRGVAPEERNEQLNPAWVQDNVVPGQDEPQSEDKIKDKDKDRRINVRHRPFEPSVVEAPAASVPSVYVIRPPNPPLDDVTNQRREKVKEMMKHGWDNYVRYAWGKNELRPISKRGHSASIFGASNMGATIVDGLDTLYIMGLHDEFKQGRDWIAENLDFDILTSFITIDFSRDLLTKVFSFTFIVLVCTIHYNVLYFKSEQVKYLFEQILYNWHALTDAEEIEIIRKCANKGRFCTILLGFATYFSILIFTSCIFIPDILDIVTPLNESRLHQLPLVLETFFDQEKHFLFVILNFILVAFVDLTTLMTAEVLYVVCIQHACGLLKLTSHRISNAFDDYSQQMFKSKRTICVKLSKAVKIHKRSLEFVECLSSIFSISYFISGVLGIASLSINLFELLKATESKNMNQVIYFSLFVIAHLYYVFWVNYFGQELIDHSADVFVQTYNVQWYMVSPHIQKDILFILHRSSKNILFSVGSIFVFSLDGVATLINTSVSYTMLLYSTRS